MKRRVVCPYHSGLFSEAVVAPISLNGCGPGAGGREGKWG
jgi:hypothetical protein